MKILVFISFNEGREKYTYVRHLLAGVGCEEGLVGGDKLLCGLYGQTFDVNDPRLELLRSVLRKERIKWSERSEHHYSDDELRTFPLLVLFVGRKSIKGGGPQYGTVYDQVSGCRTCGTGAVQTSPLMLPISELPKTGMMCETNRGHILVAAAIVDALKNTNLTGLELRQTHFYRNGEPLNWWQFIASYTMPRFSANSKNLVWDSRPSWGCPVCQRDMWAFQGPEPPDYVYDSHIVDPSAIPDIVQTWECFGRSVLHDDPDRNLQRGFAQPLILVKPKMLDIMRRLRVKEVGFSPVRMV